MPYTVESLMTLLRAKRNDGPHKVSGYSLTHPLEGSKKVTAVSKVDAIMGLQEMLGTVLTDKTRFYRVNGKIEEDIGEPTAEDIVAHFVEGHDPLWGKLTNVSEPDSDDEDESDSKPEKKLVKSDSDDEESGSENDSKPEKKLVKSDSDDEESGSEEKESKPEKKPSNSDEESPSESEEDLRLPDRKGCGCGFQCSPSPRASSRDEKVHTKDAVASTIDVIFSAPKDCSTEVIQGTEWTLKALASYHMNTMDIPYARFVHANGGDESKIYRNGDTYYKPQHEPMFAIPLDLESVQYPKAKKMVAPTFGPNSCGRKILGGGRKGQKCTNAIFRYGRCRYHLSLWKKENPFLNHP